MKSSGRRLPPAGVAAVATAGILIAWLASSHGQSQSRSSAPEVVARVGARTVGREELESRAALMRQEFTRRRGADPGPDMRPVLDRQALEMLIRGELLILEAERQKIPVSDAEAEEIVKGDAFFRENGVFSESKYRAAKASSPAAFEDALRRARLDLAARKLNDRLQQRFRPEEARVRAVAERALASGDIDVLLLSRTGFTDVSVEPSEAEVLQHYQRHAARLGRPLREAAPEIRAQLREQRKASRDDVELRAVYEARKDSLVMPAYRIRYAVADPGRISIPAPTDADLDRYYRGHLADFTSYDAASASISVRPLAEVMDQVRTGWLREQQMVRIRSLAEGLMDAWGAGRRDRRLEGSMAALRDLGPVPLGAPVDTGAIAGAITDTLMSRGVQPGVGVMPHRQAIVVYHVYELIGRYTPTFEQLRPLLAEQQSRERDATDERAAFERFERDPMRFGGGDLLHFTRAIVRLPDPMNVKLTRDEVERQYRNHIDLYVAPEEIRPLQIVVVPEGEGRDADEAARTEAEELVRRARAGEDFTELARRHSDDESSREQGGDLGFLPRGRLHPLVDRAAFALRTGEVTDPVRTEVGWHVVKVADYLPLYSEPLNRIYANVAADAAARKAELVARRRADSLYQAVRSPREALAAARKLGLDVMTYTHVLGSKAYPPDMLPDFMRLEQVPIGKLYPGSIFQKGYGAFIQWPDSVAPPRAPSWETVRVRAINDYRRDAWRRALEAKQSELDSLYRAGWSLDSLAALWGGLTRHHVRPGVEVPALGGTPVLDSLLFGGHRAPVLAEGEESGWVELTEGVARVRLTDRIEPSPTELAARIEVERRTTLNHELFLYYEDLKKRYPVRILDARLRDVSLPPPPVPTSL